MQNSWKSMQMRQICQAAKKSSAVCVFGATTAAGEYGKCETKNNSVSLTPGH